MSNITYRTPQTMKSHLNPSKKSDNILPVSKKFYEDLRTRVADTCGLIGKPLLFVRAMAVIDGYILENKFPVKACETEVMLIFTLLHSEINKAMSRSAAARKRRMSKGDRNEKAVKMSSQTGSADKNEGLALNTLNRSERRRIEREDRRLARRKSKQTARLRTRVEID